MTRSLLLLPILTMALLSCTTNNKQMKPEGNPFFSAYETPYETPVFDQIKLEHYMPAFKEGMKEHQQEIKAITDNPAPADFENTIAAMDNQRITASVGGGDKFFIFGQDLARFGSGKFGQQFRIIK